MVQHYVDDVLIAERPPEEERARREEEQFYGIAPPLPPPMERPPVVRNYEEVRAEALHQEAELRILDLPPVPPIVINRDWGPPLNQATDPARILCWGGLASAIFQVPPPNIRQDSYQVDLTNGVLLRWHARGRVRLFSPEHSGLPAPLEQRALTGRRRSIVSEAINH